MAGFFQKLKGAGSGASKTDTAVSTKTKKDEPQPDLTPVEKLLHNAGPIREDGSDKFFGLENFGNTCYCNSIVQALYHSEHFRNNVVSYPPPGPWEESNGTERKKVKATIRPPVQAIPNGNAAGASKPRQSFGAGAQLPPIAPSMRPEDKPDSPEYKKKQAMIRGPVLELAQEDSEPYGMEECTFTGLRDIFTALIDSQSRTGVLSPQRFLDIFKRNNEMFRNSMHQDAHEFYGIVLNDVIANVEAHGKRMQELAESRSKDGSSQSADTALAKADANPGTRPPGTGWVHDIFEGVLTSETRCLTCETASQRDETFLDLSIDLEEHSSVTSCLQSFSAEEMLCERNKFHCDHCGGLQEAEKRMKVKKLPKVLALHLKRFKYTEDYSRLQKLFHRVVYPYHLRLFNTTDDAEDPDRMYELYAVVVHIGGNAYHGHYVAVIKTKDRGWLLFDDEMVEPVDKHFVRNFFGDKPGMACAYVLFYQETTFEKVREELDAEGMDQVKMATQAADLATTTELVNGSSPALLSKLNTQPLSPVDESETLVTLDQIKSAPTAIDVARPVDPLPPPLSQCEAHPLVAAPPPAPAVLTEADKAATVPPKTKAEIAREKKEQKAREKAEEKARKEAEKEQARIAAKERQEAHQKMRETLRLEREQLQKAIQESKQMAAEDEKRQQNKESAATDTATSSDTGGNDEPPRNGFLNRAGRTSKSMTRKSFAFLHIGQQNNNKDEGKGGDKTDRSDASEDKGESSADGGGKAKENGNHPPVPPPPPPPPQQQQPQNGSGTSSSGKHGHLLRPWLTPRSDTAPAGAVDQLRHNKDNKDKPPLKERFSFGLGRKKSSRFLSPS
ncbi:cysteine proteinase [Parathielavia appendiculata]|uniref:Ubiquitin carboxyl-terminal hydrolase n=1 Tax=Parathielavia appendiculata TaxID=2587402 RepID=A0AAN6UAQ9_9PEZI|nr:cysteine proteinase [Parathielavia appendiculata]